MTLKTQLNNSMEVAMKSDDEVRNQIVWTAQCAAFSAFFYTQAES